MTGRIRRFRLEFLDLGGTQPVRDWIVTDLSPQKRRFIGFAMSEVLG